MHWLVVAFRYVPIAERSAERLSLSYALGSTEWSRGHEPREHVWAQRPTQLTRARRWCAKLASWRSLFARVAVRSIVKVRGFVMAAVLRLSRSTLKEVFVTNAAR